MFFLFLLLSILLPSPCVANANSEQVKVGAYIHDIREFDLRSHSYAIDFYLWFKWDNAHLNPSESFEFMNPSDVWGHSTTKAYPEPIKISTGEYYQALRIQGRFSHKFNFKNYPFDKQFLVIEFEDSQNALNSFQYTFDSVPPVGINPQLVFPGFIVDDPQAHISNMHYPTQFGLFKQRGVSEYNRFHIQVPIRRPILPYLVKLILPILCLVFCGSLMFLFNPKYIDARIGIGITALLTLVALQITQNDRLPEIDYLVLMDKIYIATYIYIILGLAEVVTMSWVIEKGPETTKKIIKTDRWFLVFLLSTYMMTLIGFLLWAIWSE